MKLKLTHVELLDFFKEEYGLKNPVSIELGVRYGTFSKPIFDKLEPKELYLVDAWEHLDDYRDSSNVTNELHSKNHQIVIDMFKDNDNVHIIKAMTVDAVDKFEDDFFDFIYIDANHQYEYVKKDIDDWYPKLKTGGVFCGDDYNPIWRGVIKAVNEFGTEIDMEINTSASKGKFSWFIQKK